MGRKAVDRGRRQSDTAEPSVEPAQVSQVPGESGRVVERSVEPLRGVDEAVHAHSGYTTVRTMRLVIIVAGEALIDLVVHPDGRRRSTPGGGPFNTARTIARLGGDVAFLGRLSEDEAGRTLRAALEADGVETRYVVSTSDPTTQAVATLDEQRAASYSFEVDGTSAAGLTTAQAAAAVATPSAALHVGTMGLVLEPIGSALASVVAALAGSTLLMVDPNCRPPVIADRAAYVARLDAVLARADIVKVSSDDLAYLAPGRSPIAAARDLKARTGATFLVTDGPRDVVVITGRGERVLPVPTVEIVDTVGSGDAFGGAFLARWMELGLGRASLADPDAVADAARLAIDVAALTCQRHGADPPTRAEAGWPVAARDHRTG